MAETNNFKGVVGLTQAQFDLLKTNGTIDVGGVTYTYDPSGTMYVTDKLAIRTLTNVSVDNWAADTTYENFGYKGSIAIDGLSANDVCEVVFSQADVESGNYASVNNSAKNTLSIYSSSNGAITIPTIIIFVGGDS